MSRKVGIRHVNYYVPETRRGKMVSVGSIFAAVVFFIIGFVGIANGYDNLGPLFILFGCLWTVFGMLPLTNFTEWQIGLIALVAMVIVVYLAVPYVNNGLQELGEMISSKLDITQWLRDIIGLP